MSARRLHSLVITPVVITLIGFSLSTSVIASDFTQSAGGTWNLNGNWDAGIPNSVGAVANFDTLDLANGSNATVTLDGSMTAGTLLLGDIVPATASLTFPQAASNWIINPGTPGSSTLTLATSSGTPTINVVNPTAQPMNSAGPASNATFFYYALFVPQAAFINVPLLGNQGLTKTGYGALVLDAADTYSGTTTVINGNSALENGTNNGVNNGGLTLDFSAGQFFSQPAPAAAPSSNIIPAANPLVLGGGLSIGGNGALNIIGNSGATNSQSFGGTTLDFGNNSINVLQNGAAAVNLSLGTLTRTNHSVVNFTMPTTGTVSANVSNTNGIIGGWATVGSGANATWAISDGSGHIVPMTTGFTDYTGTPTILSNAAANVRWSASTGNATLNSGTTDINSLIFTDVFTGTADLRTINQLAGSILRLGANGGIFRTDNIGNQTQLLLTIGNASTSYLTAGGAPNTAGELTFNANNAPINADQNGIVVTSIITNNGTGVVTVTQSGDSTTQVTQASSYSGGTYINSGRFRSQVNGGMGTGPVYTAPGAQAYFNTGTGVFYNNFYLSGMGYWETGGFSSGNVRLAANGENITGTVTLIGDSMITYRGATAAGVSISGQITGSFSPYFSGQEVNAAAPASLAITNSSNNYTGDTVVMNGRLTIGGTGEVIPDGAGKGNLVMIGEGLSGGLATNTYLNLNGNTETVNGLISTQGFDGRVSDPTRIFIENSFSNSLGTLNIGGNNASSTFAGTIRDAGVSGAGLAVPTNATVAIGKIGTGTLTLGGTNTYTGGTKILGGKIVLGNASGIGAGNLTMSGGTTLDLNGFGSTSSGTPVTVASLNGAGGTITSSTAGPGGALTLVVGNSSNPNIVNSSFGGVIQNGSAASGVALQKEGQGQLLLSGANTYTGGTLINNGGLVVTGSLASAGTVTLAASGNPVTLAANGSVGNVVLASSSNATLKPGTSTTDHSVGTMSATSLAVNNGSLLFDLSGSGPGGSNDSISVSGNANFVSGGSSTIGLTSTNGVPAAGTYTLLTAGSLTLGHTPTLDSNTTSLFSTSRYPIPTITTPSNTVKVTISGANKNLTWTGGGDGGTWDTNNTQNWSNNGVTTNDKFFTFDNVTFNSLGGSNTNINISSNVTPGSVTVSGSSSYTFSGSSVSGDTVSLTMSGTGTLTLNNSNSYGGGTLVSNGTLKLENSAAIPMGSSVTLGSGSNSGVLDLGGQTVTVGALATSGTGGNNIIGSSQGSSTLIYAGGTSTFAGKIQDTVPSTSPGPTTALTVSSGILTLAGTDNYTGGTTISSGATLKLGSSTALSSTGALTLAYGGTLDLNGNNATVGALNNDPNNGSAAGTIVSSVAGAAKITVGDPSSDSTFVGQIQDGSGTVSVAKVNNTTLTLNGINSYSGTTEVVAGTLKIGNFLALGSATGGAVIIDSNATLDLTGAAVPGGAATANLPGLNLQQKLIQVSGTGVGGNGAIVDTGNAQENAFGHIQLLGDTTFGGNDGSTGSTTANGRFDIHNSLVGSSTTANGGSLDLNGRSLTKIGSNVFGIVNTDVTAGDILVSVGVLSIEGTSNVQAATISGGPLNGQASNITVSSGAELQFSGNTGTVTRPIILNGTTTVGVAANPLAAITSGAIAFGLQAVISSPITLNGTATFEATLGGSGTINNSGTSILILNGSIGQIGGSQSIVQTTPSTLVLGAVNTYTGDTVVNAGILRLGIANAINSGSRINLGGGTFDSGGLNETSGPLLLSNSSTIDLSNGASALHFADSAAQSWSGTLTVNNWTPGSDHLFVGASATLSPTQLSDFTFAGHSPGARQSSTGEIFPTPSLILGDFNQDGHVDVKDVVAAESALTNLGAFQNEYDLTSGEFLQIADMNTDTHVNNADLQALINYLLAGNGSASPVPEPTSVILLGLGGALMLAVRRRSTHTAKDCFTRST